MCGMQEPGIYYDKVTSKNGAPQTHYFAIP